MGSCVDFGMLAPTVPARSAPAPKGPQVSSRRGEVDVAPRDVFLIHCRLNIFTLLPFWVPSFYVIEGVHTLPSKARAS